MVVRLLLILATLALTAVISPADAHDPAISGITIVYRHDDVVVSVMTHLSRLLKAEGMDSRQTTLSALDQSLQRRLQVRFAGKALRVDKVHVIEDRMNDLINWQTITNSASTDCEVLSRIYPEDPGSITIVNVMREGQSVKEVLLDSAHPAFSSRQSLNRALEARRYLREGVLHILSGPDHILFVLGLLLLGGSLRSLLTIVTAFTIAHSITLSMAATGTFAPPSKIVEPLIALSIVAVAIENLRFLSKRQTQIKVKRDFRSYCAFAFGLIHGFGFAGALVEVGLPNSALWVALASFNIGVECGQALIVLTVAPLLAWLALKQPKVSRHLVFAASVCIGLVGGFWFVTRI